MEFLTLHFHQILFIVATLIVIFTLYLIDRSGNNSVEFSDLFLGDSGKVEGSKFRLNMAFILSSIGLIYLLLTDSISEFYFGTYISAFVVDRAISKLGVINGKTTQTTTVAVPKSADDVQ